MSLFIISKFGERRVTAVSVRSSFNENEYIDLMKARLEILPTNTYYASFVEYMEHLLNF